MNRHRERSFTSRSTGAASKGKAGETFSEGRGEWVSRQINFVGLYFTTNNSTVNMNFNIQPKLISESK